MRVSLLLLLLLLASPALAQEPSARVLTLEEALSRARELNPSLRAAAANTEAADARHDRARSVLLPQLVGSASYLRTTANFVPRPGQLPSNTNIALVPPSWDTFNFWTFGATASILLYDFQGSIDRLRGAKETRRAFAERTRVAQLAVEFAVRDAFFRTRAQRDLVNVARETLANNQRHVEQIQVFVEVGTRPEIDLAQVRTDLANARVQLVQAENAHAIAKANLRRAMGSEDAGDFDVADQRLPPLEDERAPLDKLLSRAMSDRPDVTALERDLRASQLAESAAKGAFGPSLMGSSTLTDSGRELHDLRFNWNAGVQLNWAIVRGGATFAEVREAKANGRRVQADISQLRQTVRLQVEQAQLAVSAAEAVIEAAAEALANAKARQQLAEGRYEAGVGNVIELGDAQVALTQAEAQSVSAEYGLSLARAQLLSALGRTR